MQSKFLFILLFVVSMVTGSAGAQSPVLGRWRADENEGYIEIYQSNGKYYGKLLNAPTALGRPKLDIRNPNAAMRSNTLYGTNILNDFEDSGNGVFENGTVYDPQSGKSYKAKLTVKGNHLDLRAFVGFSMFGKTVSWKRTR